VSANGAIIDPPTLVNAIADALAPFGKSLGTADAASFSASSKGATSPGSGCEPSFCNRRSGIADRRASCRAARPVRSAH
jgi:hypothetical protein